VVSSCCYSAMARLACNDETTTTAETTELPTRPRTTGDIDNTTLYVVVVRGRRMLSLAVVHKFTNVDFFSNLVHKETSSITSFVVVIRCTVVQSVRRWRGACRDVNKGYDWSDVSAQKFYWLLCNGWAVFRQGCCCCFIYRVGQSERKRGCLSVSVLVSQSVC